jgi:hypothetical protein
MISASIAVVEAVAQQAEVAPTELDPPLSEVIDTDALNSLCGPASKDGSNSRGRVVFQYIGYDITVRFDGTVEVR